MQHRFFASIVWQDVYEKKVRGGLWAGPPQPHPYSGSHLHPHTVAHLHTHAYTHIHSHTCSHPHPCWHTWSHTPYTCTHTGSHLLTHLHTHTCSPTREEAPEERGSFFLNMCLCPLPLRDSGAPGPGPAGWGQEGDVPGLVDVLSQAHLAPISSLPRLQATRSRLGL